MIKEKKKRDNLASIGGIGVPGTISRDAAENSIPLLKREGISKSCLTGKYIDLVTTIVKNLKLVRNDSVDILMIQSTI